MTFKITSLEIRVRALLDGADHAMQQILTGRGWGGCGTCTPCPALQNYTRNILIITPPPQSVNAPLVVGMHINSSEEAGGAAAASD